MPNGLLTTGLDHGDGASTVSSFVAGLAFGVLGAIFAGLLFVLVKFLGNDMPW